MDKLNFDVIYDKITNRFEIDKKLAKSEGKTIKSHINDLLQELSNFCCKYETILNNEDIDILKLSILFHDIGKLNKLFQDKIKNNREINDIVPHNFLSPLFLKLISYVIKDENLYLLTYIITNHHSRGKKYLENEQYGLSLLIEDIKSNQDNFFDGFKFSEETLNNYKVWLEQGIVRKKEKKYLILSGLLIRLDHAASGDLEVEEEPINEDRKALLLKYLEKEKNSNNLKPFQEKFGLNNKKDYQCIVADTGLGKTGLSVLWSNRKKFYILPNRASVNAMFNTLCKIYGEDKVGLLHSTALYNLLDLLDRENLDDDFDIIKQYEQTRILSKPVTICTADQLFTAAFNMPGYEKIYATLAYSDIVIDEIQGFQPQQIIPILKQIRETKELGARYLVITATLPYIVLKKLEEMNFEVIQNDEDTIDKTRRHKIRIEKEKHIDELVDEIISKYKNNAKVLVITNTVKKAQDLFCKIEDLNNGINVNILHSRFIWKDRQEKEKRIIQDSKIKNYGCIWIATQLVEASLDIDFDYLFTEAATADSLIQRMGRVWRHRISDYNGEENIIIAGRTESKIYEEVLTKQTIKMIEETIKNKEGFLLSENKREIVKTLYSEENLKECSSKYLEDWRKFEQQINSGWNFIIEDNAQKAFRDVMTIELIPNRYQCCIQRLWDEMIKEMQKIDSNSQLNNQEKKKDKKLVRNRILKSIQEYKVPIPLYLVNPRVCQYLINSTTPINWINRNYNIGILNENYEYNEEIGLTGKIIEIEENENIL